ncbi:YCII-related domain protein [Colletotrichum plurivorum]|uniref:YCII-related domain protein n=1 Tax=Colletotrichum plurivorum TaxID=2175906 RepID=A0A8H6ND29_9PEZI|nr:YCII-related domain protein [Colletotrichum plurivorum]
MSLPTRLLRKSLIPASRSVIRSSFVTPTSPLNFCYRTMATTTKEFLCILPDKPDALAKRLEVRPTHLADVKPLVAAGKVAVGGAMFEEHPAEGKQTVFKGSMIIYTVKDAEEAWELIKNDIYAKSGVWDLEKAQVIPYISAVRQAL